MFSRSINRKLVLFIGLLCLPSTFVSAQAYKEGIGYNQLVAEKGAALEDGAGLAVVQVEAPSGANYMPDVSDPQFAGKTFTLGSGASGASAHATSVGRRFYGLDDSMAAGITDITGYDANDFLGNLLGANSGNDPTITTAFDVSNHSYVGRDSATFTGPIAEDILERFDFVINRDNTVAVVGSDNGSAAATPRVLAPSYNAITVGRSDGAHSQSLTPNYGAPRFATAIVVPDAGVTSFATAVVSSAAALLRDAGTGSNFVQNEVIRAALFAGATKEEFASWDRTATRPMDEVFGYGELNILNSYHIFEGGEFDGATSDPATNVGDFGWDYGMFDGANDLYYDFTIDTGDVAELSAILSWNMEITDTDAGAAFVASRSLADLNLDLFDSSGTFLGNLLDSSNGTDYNNEHIFFQGLTAGDYTLQVSGDSATDFGLAWMITPVPEPSSVAVLGLISLGLMARRRRRSAAVV